MQLFGIRGATTVNNNSREEIIEATKLLLQKLILLNELTEEKVVSIIFTTTPDLTADFPAKACREIGWNETALLGAVESDVPHGIKHCIRILVHAYLQDKSKVKHVYLNKAIELRPDLIN